MDHKQNVEVARRQAAQLQEQLEQLRARGGDPAAEAKLENELLQVYKVLGSQAPAGPATGQPAMGQPVMGQPVMGQPGMGQPVYPQQAYGQQPYRNYEGSRATTILVFGILSIVVCQLFGPFAWSMGNADLRKVDEGLMDPRERGTIQAGRICGIVGTVLMIVSLVAFFGMLLLGAAASSNY